MRRIGWEWSSPFVELWLLLGLALGALIILSYSVEGRILPWRNLVAWYFTWCLWIPLGRRLLVRFRRWPAGFRWRRRTPLLLAFGGATVGGMFALRLVLDEGLHVLTGSPLEWHGLRAVEVQSVVSDLFVFAGLVAVAIAETSYRRYSEREIRSVQLESQLAGFQLRFLRAQLHPHFLFNSLHMVSALIYDDPDRADRILSDVADLLRLSLENAERQEVRLAEELGFVDRYLDIARESFGERLEVETRIEPEAMGAWVPNLILQPLVENSIQHGVKPKDGRTKIVVSAARAGEWVVLKVLDDGAGLGSQSGGGAAGIGIKNIRQRLRQLYGEDYRFDLMPRSNGGVVATVEIPYRQHPVWSPDDERPAGKRR